MASTLSNKHTSPLLAAAIRPPMRRKARSSAKHARDDDDTSIPPMEVAQTGSSNKTADTSDESRSLANDHDEEDGMAGPGFLGDSSEHSTTSSDEAGDQNRPGNNIVHNETKLVNCSKMAVVIIVSCLAAIVGVSTYFYVANREDTDFNTSYENAVSEIRSSCQLRIRNILDNLEAVSVSLTTQAAQARMQWPFVVFPDFQVQGMISNQVTGASTLSIHPFVSHNNRTAWEMFSVEQQGWFDRAHMYDDRVNPHLYQDTRPEVPENHLNPYTEREAWNESGVTPYIWKYDEDLERVKDTAHSIYFPSWQTAPAEDFLPTTNLNFADRNNYDDVIRSMVQYDRPVLTASGTGGYLGMNYDQRFDIGPNGPPRSYLLQPIYDSLLLERKMVAFLSAFVGWDNFFQGALPVSEKKGLMVVMDGTCDHQTMSFQVSGSGVVYLGKKDRHDPRFEHMAREIQFDEYVAHGRSINQSDSKDTLNLCKYSATIYPTEEYADCYFSDMPIVYAVLVVTCFLITTICFAFYDCLVQRRQKILLETATKTNAIVSSLFPSNVRDRLLEELKPIDNEKMMKPTNGSLSHLGPRHPLNNSAANLFDASLEGSDFCATSEAIFGSKPIADLFPSTTIMFADMVGFTAWSSSREPTQVFTLLETVYHSFDQLALKRRVFKVETVGDCYVAVCGLPIARKDHAVSMARFASDCLYRMNELTSQLEKTLGPDTADLSLRIGLHSGQVTAGVLRGEKGRFQLFGDTMNTASRMESTGAPHKIHVSAETADLLVAANKGKWVVPREDKIHAKGKGELQTYWLRIQLASLGSTKSLMTTDDSETGSDDAIGDDSLRSTPYLLGGANNTSSRTQRLIDYNVDILAKLLHQIVVRRTSNPPRMATRNRRKALKAKEGPVIDEVIDILALPQFDPNNFKNHVDPDSIMVSPRVHQQLVLYVAKVAELYRDNPFHNFEHASHVTMSVTKLLSRIVNPADVHNRDGKEHKVAKNFHDHTFGITSDPLTHFACVLSALIHDADHPGVGNSVLVKEKDPLAIKYKDKSVAEQNSVEASWNILMQEDFDDLRACIYGNEEEFARFRQVVVNIVLATDIMDKELGALRKARWEIAFAGHDSNISTSKKSNPDNDDAHTATARKATIVLEYVIQASDVAHTMQHWHVYRKWNERLFHEMYQAYLQGRLDVDPSVGWYQGEIGFFDFYIIPLAKKLETCGVFGVSSDEYLNYAKQNRSEWIGKGEAIVEGYLKSYNNNSGSSRNQQQPPKKEEGKDCVDDILV